MYPIFRSITKCSLLKLLCTLACLCEGTPLQPLRLDFFGSTFPRNLAHNSHFALFAGRTTEQGERRTYTMSALPSPTFPPQRHRSPPHLPLFHRQCKLHATLRHSASQHALEGIFPLCFAKCFLLWIEINYISQVIKSNKSASIECDMMI